MTSLLDTKSIRSLFITSSFLLNPKIVANESLDKTILPFAIIAMPSLEASNNDLKR